MANPLTEWASYPLSIYDTNHSGEVMTLGWIVEGWANEEKLERAIAAVTRKWRLLAARVVKDKSDPVYRLHVPIGAKLPEEYLAYRFTTSIAPAPLSAHVQLPFETSCNVLPPSLMRSANTPTSTQQWCNQDVPLLHWHITRFSGPTSTEGQSWIAVTFPHLVFDGFGIATVVHLVEAELQGKRWDVPFHISSGQNDNLLERVLGDAQQEKEEHRETWIYARPYSGLHVRWIGGIIILMFWFLWQKVWNGAEQRVFRLPPRALQKLLEVYESQSGSVRVSRGDIYVSFITKAIFGAENVSKSTRVSLYNMASLRRFFDGKLSQYPFNSVIPLPSPVLSVEELRGLPIPSLAHAFSQSRRSFVLDTAVQAHETMLAATKLFARRAIGMQAGVEALGLSNMTSYGIVNIDWTGCGVGKTLLRQKKGTTVSGVEITNNVVIVGHLGDGSLLLDVHLTKQKRASLERAIRELVEAADKEV